MVVVHPAKVTAVFRSMTSTRSLKCIRHRLQLVNNQMKMVEVEIVDDKEQSILSTGNHSKTCILSRG
jgi:hypothetical protein